MYVLARYVSLRIYQALADLLSIDRAGQTIITFAWRDLVCLSDTLPPSDTTGSAGLTERKGLTTSNRLNIRNQKNPAQQSAAKQIHVEIGPTLDLFQHAFVLRQTVV